MAPSVTHMLQELGADNDIVACTQQCPLPLARVAQLAVGSFASLNKEKLLAAQPELIVTATVVQAQGAREMSEQGLPVLHLDPRRLSDIADTYLELGHAVGQAEKGAALQQAFQDRAAALAKEATTRRRLKIYMEEWHEPPFVAGNWVPDMVALAGGEAVLAQPGEPSRRISLKELIAADPDIIVQHVCLPPGRNWTAQRQKMAESLAERLGWKNLRAVRQGRVYAMDDSPFNMPTQGILEGVEILRQVIAGVRV